MPQFSNFSLLFTQQSQEGPLRWELIIFYVCLSSSKGPSPVSWFFTRYGRYCSPPLRSHQSQSHLGSFLLFFLEFSMGCLPLPLQPHRRWAGTRLTNPSWDSVVCVVATLWFFRSWWWPWRCGRLRGLIRCLSWRGGTLGVVVVIAVHTLNYI